MNIDLDKWFKSICANTSNSDWADIKVNHTYKVKFIKEEDLVNMKMPKEEGK